MQYLMRQNIGPVKNIDGISPILLDILNKRGIEDVNGFLHPSLSMLHNPFLLKNLQAIVDKIKQAAAVGRFIVINGSRDIDGACSAAILYLGLRGIASNITCYISENTDNHLDLSEDTIRMFGSKTPNALIVTANCGINSNKSIELAKSLGLEVIVIDRHILKGEEPDCLFINPMLDDYPFKDLCGAALALKVLQAVRDNSVISKYIDIVTIATLALSMPLTGENRVFVKFGLEFINKIQRPGLKALTALNPVETITVGDMIGKYIPMLDASAKLGRVSDITRILSSYDKTTEILAKNFAELNRQLRALEDNTYMQAIKQVEDGDKCIILSGDWNKWTLANAAEKIENKCKKPCILLTRNKNGLYFGSVKQKNIVNMDKLLSQCPSISLIRNENTIDFYIKGENLDTFKRRFSSLCPKQDSSEMILCDLQLKMSDITKGLYDTLKCLYPFGVGNPAVKIKLTDISMKNVIVRAGKHFSASIFDETGICDAICFNSAIPESLDNIDMVVTLGISKYKGKEKIQCQIHFLMKNGNSLRRPALSPVTNYGVRMIDQPIEVLGLNERKLKQFTNVGIDTIQKLINYFPTKYNDFRYTKTAIEINEPEMGAIVGKVGKVRVTPKITYAMCTDKNGDTFMACWFHQDYVARMLSSGYDYIFCGRLNRSDKGMPQVYPMYFSTNIDKYKTIIPEYKKITGMSAEYLTQSIDKAMQIIPNTDFLDKDIVSRFEMLSDYDATIKLHHPRNDFEIRDGQRRKIFNELFEFNFILKSRNKTNVSSQYLLKQKDKLEELKKLLPYTLTDDQTNCINNIYNYMNSGKILNALVQGDVGSGKTMVALFSMLLAINNGYQTCLIAPTEVLAQQHYAEISGYLDKLGYKTGYLVGGMKVREKKALLKGLKSGEINAVVGTHAIIQKDVEFYELAVVVIDEEHKFGVAQREKLANIQGPHMISMSATPIPRTLSMAIYGENIQVYSIKQKPAGRKEIMTLKMFNDNDVNNFMLQQIRQGRQCYVVCPMIEESDEGPMSGIRSVTQEAQAMIDWFKQYPEVRISNATGRMKKELIAEEIDKFTRNETNILISTTIIEVGVNVPNATVMVLKSSERFGLAQAHQLRGRVGRGNYQSYCILQTDMDDPKADILCDTTDGFEIARQDLLLRGSGDYIGTQQTGNNRNVMLMMSEPEMYKGISEINDEIYKNPAKFAKYSYILDSVKEE